MGLARDEWIPVQRPDVVVGIHNALRIGPTGAASLCAFQFDGRFANLILLEVIGVPSAAAATTDQDIDIRVDYAQVLEAVDFHTAADTATLYDLTGTSGQITVIADAAALVSEPVAGHLLTVQVAHNDLGGPIDYLGVRVCYVVY